MNKIRFLGTGTSTGVPEIGCPCAVCTSRDPRDNRLRTSALIQIDDTNLLMDCGPDFREQTLRWGRLEKLDAVLLSHEHYDHVGGLDDLRPFSRLGEIPIYADAYTAGHLRERMPYCFIEHTYPGVPRIYLQEAEPGVSFRVKELEITPITVMHGRLPILGYRIGRLGYVTDMLTMPDASYQTLQGVDILVLNALRPKPHPTHQSLSEALRAVERIGARETYLVHASHHIGLHADLEQQLPPHVHYAYDGLEVTF